MQLTPANTSVAIYTTPSGETTIIKRVILHNAHTAAITFYLGVAGIGPNASSNYMKRTVAADSYEDIEVWWVVPETVPFNARADNNVGRVSMFGAELEGVAD